MRKNKKFKWVGGILSCLILLAALTVVCSKDIQNFMAMTYLNLKTTTKLEVKDKNLYMDGIINQKTYDQFVKILNDNPQIETLIEGDIPGSIDDDTMIKLAYFVRKKGLNTKILSNSDINSGGVDLFLAGVKRTMEKGAKIGVHSWSDGEKDAAEYPVGSPEHEANRKYIEIMLGSDDFYWFTIYAAKADSIHEMSEKEIIKYKLLTQPVKM